MTPTDQPKPLPPLDRYDPLPVAAGVDDTAWRTVTARYPPGSTAAGPVVARAPFGVFIDLDGLALGLINVPHLPVRVEAGRLQWPNLGDELSGQVWGHDALHRQVRLTADNPISQLG